MEQIVGIFSESFWYIAPILAALTVTVTGVINNTFNIKNGIWPQIVSWLVGSGLTVGAWALELVIFGDPVWLSIICMACVIGLSSNGIYDIPTIKKYVDSWFKKTVK